jgi:anthranilate synthase/aminodeoxychorismate synthase-like glutamine amidotransferase
VASVASAASEEAIVGAPRVLVVDNYDSFTYNLVQELGELGAVVEVVRNDAFAVAEVVAEPPDGVVISPGPGSPDDAGLSNDLILARAGLRPVLGVCLGHQCIGQLYGGSVVQAPVLMHGKTSPIYHRSEGVFADLPSPFDATRYHSLVVNRDSVPAALQVTAETADGLVMGLRHRENDVEGVQFHPESILTGVGMRLLGTWLARLEVPVRA